MTKESVERERELIAQLRESTSVQEVLERARALKWNISEGEAREYLDLITPDDPKEMENNSQKDGLSVEERLAIDKMMTEEWFAWMAKRNKKQKQDFQKPSLKEKEAQCCDIDDDLDTKLHNLRVAKNASEKEAAWRNLIETEEFPISKDEMDLLMGRRDWSPEGDV